MGSVDDLLAALLLGTGSSHPGELGIYGPTWRDVFHYDPMDLDLLRYMPPDMAMATMDGILPAALNTSLVHVNQVLLQTNCLVIPDLPSCPTSLHDTEVGWGESLIWADEGGGLTLNCRGRQRTGAICIIDYHRMRYRLATQVVNRLKPLIGEVGVIYPYDEWDPCNGVPPDFLLKAEGYYFTDLVGVEDVVTPSTRELLDKTAIGRLHASIH